MQERRDDELNWCNLSLMSPATGRRAILMYLLVTWTVSCLFYFLIIKSAGSNSADGAYTAGLMWCPAIGALLTCKYLGRPIASLGWKWGKTRYQVISYLIPLGYSTVTYSVAWLTGIAALKLPTADAYSRYFGLGAVSRPLGIGMYFLVVGTIGVTPKLHHHAGRGNRVAWIPGARVSQTFFIHHNRGTLRCNLGVVACAHHRLRRIQRGDRRLWFGGGLREHDRPLLRPDMAAPEIRQLVDRRHSARFQ